MGERVWLNHKQIPLPKHHQNVPNILAAIASLGMVFVIWGLIDLKLWPTVFGMVIIYMGKLWFIDRMVWIYHDMKDADSQYRQWLY